MNAIIKTNLISDVNKFFKDYVHVPLGGGCEDKGVFMWFWKAVVGLMESAARREGREGFKRNLGRSLGW